jgi:hypothetical protein
VQRVFALEARKKVKVNVEKKLKKKENSFRDQNIIEKKNI